MNERRIVKLIDASQNVLAIAQVRDEGPYLGGTIDLARSPAGVRALFGEFEEAVNGQMFSYVDEIQERINGLGVRAVLDDDSVALVEDLQVFPSTGEVSFKLACSDCSRHTANPPSGRVSD